METEMHKELEFVVLDAPERSRTYYYAKGESITFRCIEQVCVRPSGTHRLIVNPAANDDNRLVVVRGGWLAIAINADEWTF